MNKLLPFIKDIRYVIVFFFLIRLFGITNPPLERNHNWRQVTTNMYARNFLEVDNNILYARVDMAGDLTGITAKEFPFFNYMIYLTAEVFGWQHWYGRLISLIISSIGVYFFFRLIKDFVSEDLSYPATVVLLASIWFGHSRIIMPDTFSVSLVMAGLYFALSYFEKGKFWRVALFFVLATLGALCKLPSGFLLSVLIIPFFQKKYMVDRKIAIAVFGATLLYVCGWWYFSWLPYLVETYGYEHYPMRSVFTGAKEIFGDLSETFERFYISALKGYIAFTLYVVGVVLLFVKKQKKILLPFIVLSVFFFLYMCKAGESFYNHNYYIIPFAPVMALIVAYAISFVPKPLWRNVLLFAIVVEGVANQQDAFRINPRELHKLELEKIADEHIAKKDLIAINQPVGNPQELYFAHRKGWVLLNQEIIDKKKREGFKSKGCKYIFISKKYWNGDKIDEELVFENEFYWLFRL